MDSETLKCCLRFLFRKAPHIQHQVIARDQLFSIDYSKLPLAVIVNCSDSNTRGSHWISFYVYRVGSRLVGDYFDSYSNPLSKYIIFPPFSIKEYNRRVLQSNNSVVCGLYALFYLYWRSQGKSVEAIESKFTYNLKQNDFRIKRYYTALIRSAKGKTLPHLTCCTRLVNIL